MADLVTHACTALLVKATSRAPRNLATFLAGTCIPDLLGRVPSMALIRLRYDMTAVPEWLIYVWNVFHLPIGVLGTAFILSFLFPEDGRRRVFASLAWGGVLHLAVDLVQAHMGMGYMLFFPLSTWDFELGWIGSEDTVRIVPGLAPVTALVCWLRWRRPPP